MINIKTFLVVDGHSLAHRAFHGVNVKLTSPAGTPTAMIVGFMNMLFRVQDEVQPVCTVIAFDASGQGGVRAFRYNLQADYKGGRRPLPDDLRVQLPLLQDLLRCLGFRVIIREDVEADDVVASVARLAQKNGYEAVMLTSDKDLFQVLGEGVYMMRPVKNGIAGAETYDAAKFTEEFGFLPSSMADYLALIGDTSDNIKGIKGIGKLTAQKLLACYPTIEQIFDSLPELPKSTRTKLEAADREKVIWTRDRMIRLRDDLFDGDEAFLTECLNFPASLPQAENLAVNLGLSRILERIGSLKRPMPRILSSQRGFVPPEAGTLIDDYKTALKLGTDVPEDVWDLRTAYYLLHPDAVASSFPEILSYLKSTDNPAQTLAEIAGGLQAEIEAHAGLKDVMNKIDLPLIPVLCRMEEHGVRISPAHFDALRAELEEKILQLEAGLVRETGVRINMNSPQQVSWLLFEHLGFTPSAKTKAGANSVDAAVLTELAKPDNATAPRILLKYRELSKMLTGFVVPLMNAGGSEGIIHTTFEPAITGTGRLSSRDPNLQNIPAFGEWAARIKAGLLPVQEGNVFVGADYSQIELRVFAHLSGEERLLDAFRKGRDIHSETASWVFGVIPHFVTPELRRTAKMINFGLLYGMTEFGLAERLGVPRAEAKDIMQKYFAALPGLKGFLEETVDGAKERGYTRTLAGRIRPVKEIPARGPALDRALINSPIQGTAADVARRAMIAVERAAPGKMFLQVHDSIVCECREDEAEDVSEMLRDVMKSAGGEIDNLEVEIKRGKSLADV